MTDADVRMGLYLLVSDLNALALNYKKEILAHYKTNQVVTTIVQLASEGLCEPTADDLNLRLQCKDVNPIFIDRIMKVYSELDRSETIIKGIRHFYKNIVTSKLIDEAAAKITDLDKYTAEITRIGKLDFGEGSVFDQAVKNKKFSELDIAEMEASMDKVVPSFWKPLNESNPYGGYREEQLVTVCGAPGSGKSFYLMQELLKNLEAGRHCIYCAIGDLIEEDFIVRLAALKFRVPLSDIYLDFRYYQRRLLEEIPQIEEKLSILFIKPGKLSATDLQTYLEENEFRDEPTTFFIDYDSNLNGNESLYMKGDEIYCVAEAMAARPKYLGFIATQPKIMYFGSEMFSMDGLGESSRKAHISATIITIGVNQNSVNPVGYINICKQRRGVKFVAPYFRDLNGEFIMISEQQKSELAQFGMRRTIVCQSSDAGRYDLLGGSSGGK